MKYTAKTVKKLSILIIALFSILLFAGVSNVAYAGEKTKDEVESDLSQAVDEVLARLNLDSLQNLDRKSVV